MQNTMTQEELFKKLVAHCKEYGFIFPSSEIYDGLGAVYDYGQNGVELKNNIKRYWWDSMVRLHENIVGLDSAIFMHPRTWEASGHVGAFNDPLIDNKDSKKRYRADVLIEEWLASVQLRVPEIGQTISQSRMIRRSSSRSLAFNASAKRLCTESRAAAISSTRGEVERYCSSLKFSLKRFFALSTSF